MVGDRVFLYTLNGKRPEACSDTIRWAMWMEANYLKRHVAKTTVGECWVSTVFLGTDHGFGRGAPVLFETMAFGPPETEWSPFFKKNMTHRPEIGSMRRYTTWEDAERGHAEIVADVEAILKNNEKTAEEVLKLVQFAEQASARWKEKK